MYLSQRSQIRRGIGRSLSIPAQASTKLLLSEVFANANHLLLDIRLVNLAVPANPRKPVDALTSKHRRNKQPWKPFTIVVSSIYIVFKPHAYIPAPDAHVQRIHHSRPGPGLAAA